MEGKESNERHGYHACQVTPKRERTIELSTRKHHRYPGKDREGKGKAFEQTTVAVGLCTPGWASGSLDGGFLQQTA